MPANVARIGRSYPRQLPPAGDTGHMPRARLRLRFTITSSVVAFVSALASLLILAGWLILR